jgi:hypothetical protein
VKANPPEYKYKLTYKIERITKKEMLEDPKRQDEGAADAFVFVSILYPPDGSLSTMIFARDGRNGKVLDDLEVFKVWTMIAKQLSESKSLSFNKQVFCQHVFKSIQQAIVGH